MNRTEFAEEFERLVSGFNHQITTERIEALYSKYGWLTLPAWKAVVDECLCGRAYPTAGEIAKAVDHARDHRRATGPAEHAPLPRPEEMTTEYAHFRMDLAKRIMGKKLTPTAAAAIMRDALDRFPKHRASMEAEIAEWDGTAAWRDVSTVPEVP